MCRRQYGKWLAGWQNFQREKKIGSESCSGSRKLAQIAFLQRCTYCYNFLNKNQHLFLFFCRADCSNVDKAGRKPEHNGLSSFGKVSKSKHSLISRCPKQARKATGGESGRKVSGHLLLLLLELDVGNYLFSHFSSSKLFPSKGSEQAALGADFWPDFESILPKLSDSRVLARPSFDLQSHLLFQTVIKELNRLGMIIDLSHSSHKTSLDALETSEAPVIFSHSSAFALCNSTRNVQDDVLKLVVSL